MDCLGSYIRAAEAAGSPLDSIQDIVATENHAQLRADAVGEIQLWTAQSGYQSLFHIFLEKWTDLQVKDGDVSTALHRVALSGQLITVQLLVEEGVDIMAMGKGWRDSTKIGGRWGTQASGAAVA